MDHQVEEDNPHFSWELNTTALGPVPVSLDRLLEEELDDDGQLVTSTDTSIIRQSLRVYGSVYLCFLLIFCYMRAKYPKWYNIRSWVPQLKCELAQTQTYGILNWAWKVLYVNDLELVEQIGMDALCFCRSLRMGLKLAFFGSFCAIFLLPMYYTAPDSEETQYLQDSFVLLSVSNLPSGSSRFAGTVLATYFISLFALYLITKEYSWYIQMRHHYLALPRPQNYAIYVSGIPHRYRSSFGLRDYFQKTTRAVVEAYLAMDIPSLEQKVSKRDKVVSQLERAMVLEMNRDKQSKAVALGQFAKTTLTNAKTSLGNSFQSQKSQASSQRSGSAIERLETELDQLNQEISLRIGEVLNQNDKHRQHLRRSQPFRASGASRHLDVDINGEEDESQSSSKKGTRGPSGRTSFSRFSWRRGGRSSSGRPRSPPATLLSHNTSNQNNDSSMSLQPSLPSLEPIPESQSPKTETSPKRSPLKRDEEELVDEEYPPDRLLMPLGLSSNERASSSPTLDSTIRDSHLFRSNGSDLTMTVHDNDDNEANDDDEEATFGYLASEKVLSPDTTEEKDEQGVHPFLQIFGLGEISGSMDPDDDEHNDNVEDDDDYSGNDSTISTTNNSYQDLPKAFSAEAREGMTPVTLDTIVDYDSTPPRRSRKDTEATMQINNRTESSYMEGIDGDEEALDGVPELGRDKFPTPLKDNRRGHFRHKSRSESDLSKIAKQIKSYHQPVPLEISNQPRPPKKDIGDMRPRINTRRSFDGWNFPGRSSLGRLSSGRTSDSREEETSNASSTERDRRSLAKIHRQLLSTEHSVVGRRLSTAAISSSRAVSDSIKKVRDSEAMRKASDHASSGVRKAKEGAAKSVKLTVDGVKKSKDLGVKTIQKAPEVGAKIVASAQAFAPRILRMKGDGNPREAGFVVFENFYSTHSARQMIQSSKATKMEIQAAPRPEDVFWPNVGLPAKAKRTGRLTSIAATVALCIFWSIPTSFISSLTELNSLKQRLPRLGTAVENNPWLEDVLAVMAPLLLLFLNESILPFVLKYFSRWEGHVSSPALEAALFSKLCFFAITQTFFISSISGTISAELENILNNPDELSQLLANSLPAQSSYMLQIIFVSTFVLQGVELIRAWPLGLALIRRYVGPNLTAKERRTTWKHVLTPLEDPPEFEHAEVYAQLVLFYVVFFVYSSIAPMVSVFMAPCCLICESGYRYHFIHNHKPTPDSGGTMYKTFINVVLVSMLIGQVTLMGLLALKDTVYALPSLLPLSALTVLYMVQVLPKKTHAANFLPAMTCVELDEDQDLHRPLLGGGRYLQPALLRPRIYPDVEESENDTGANLPFEDTSEVKPVV